MKKNRKNKPAPPPGLPPEQEQPIEEQPKKQPFLKRLLFGEETPDLSELEAGSTTILDILSPTSVDTKSRDYIVVDGIFHAYLYITGYGYSTTVGASWLAPLVEAGEGVSISFHFDKQSKEKILAKIAITSTQGMQDLFSLDNGKYGKGILDSSRIKIVMQMEEQEARLIQNVLNLSEEEVRQITRFRRGEGLLCIGYNHVPIAFYATQKEYDAITTSPTDLLNRKEREA